MDRLRSAFSSAINMDNFVKGSSPKNMLKQLQDALTGAKRLQANAAELAGMGYSQTFIEQVVKNGPRVGNKIAESLKNASPETNEKLKALYAEVETISNTGMDGLAKTMNSGGKLATQELMNEYKKVATDLSASLTEVNKELNENLAEAHADYQNAMADAQRASMDRLSEAKARMDESIADALVTLTRSRAEAKKQLDEGLAEAAKTLSESLAETQKKYGEAIDKINKDTVKKIEDLKSKLAEVAALMAALGAQQAAASALANAPTFTPYLGGASTTAKKPGDPGFIGPVATTVNITGYNLTSPTATGAAVSNQLKYGSTVNTTTLAGILAASAPKATTPAVSNKIRAMGMNIL
jgi:chromosome segregation ATPase